MPEYIVTDDATGKKFKIGVPEGTTEAEILAYAKEQIPNQGTLLDRAGGAVSRGVSAVKDFAVGSIPYFADLGRGGAQGQAGLNAIQGKIPDRISVLPLAIQAWVKANTGKSTKQIPEEVFPLPDPATEGNTRQIVRTGLEGAGAIAATGGINPTAGAQAVGSGLATGATGNLAAQGTVKGIETVFPSAPEKLKEIAALLAGGLIGTGTARLTGPGLNKAEQRIRETVGATADADWPQIEKNRQLLADTKTGTLAEAFPKDHPIIDLAVEAKRGKGGVALQDKLVGRVGESGELASFRDQTLNNMGTPVEPLATANQTADAANALRSYELSLPGKELTRKFAGVKVPFRAKIEVFKALDAAVASTDDAVLRGELRKVKQSFVGEGPDNRPKVLDGLQQWSIAVKRMKEAPASPTAATGTIISKKDTAKAIAVAEKAMRDNIPLYDEAMGQFALSQQTVGKGMRESLVSALADTNPNIDRPTPSGRLNKFVTDVLPSTTNETATALNNPQRTKGATVNPVDIAQALVRMKVPPGNTNPGAIVDPIRGHLAELLKVGGENPEAVFRPVDQANLLQSKLTGTSSGTVQDQMLPIQSAAIRTRRYLDFLASAGGREGLYKKVAEMLAEPSVANLKRVQEIAMFDPQVRKMLMVSGAITPAILQEGQ